MAQQNGADLDAQSVRHVRLRLNKYNEYYAHGVQMGEERKAFIIDSYVALLAESNGRPAPVLALSKRAGVCWKVARRIIDEYHVGVAGCCVEKAKKESRPGTRIGLTNEHETFLLWLRFEDPFRTNDDYVNRFFFQFGIKLARSFITCWFKDRFEKHGRLKAAQIIPVDKFRPENVDSYESFCGFVSGIGSERLCFVDEKSL